MYILDFVKRLFRKGNLSLIVYLVLNVCIIGCVSYFFLPLPSVADDSLSTLDLVWRVFLPCAGVGVLVYALSLFVAVSPVGEWILRVQNRCRKIGDEKCLAALEPVFREVYERARREDPTIPDDVGLFMNDDPGLNAFALGRRTICVTKGMMGADGRILRAVLGHEFGHLAHKDTDSILMISVGNLIVTLIFVALQVIISLFGFFTGLVLGRNGWLGRLLGMLVAWFYTALISLLMWLWTEIGVLLVRKSMRESEFEADAFSGRLGYGDALCVFLGMDKASGSQGLFAALSSTHPSSEDRIARLRNNA